MVLSNGDATQFWQQHEEEFGSFSELLCSTQTVFDPQFRADSLKQRLRFLFYDLFHRISLNATEAERRKILNEFFFTEKRFRLLEHRMPHPRSFRAHLLGDFLTCKEGMADIATALYFLLARAIRLHVDFVHLAPSPYLRWRHNGQTEFINLQDQGACLDQAEVLRIMNEHYRQDPVEESEILKPVTWQLHAQSYLNHLRASLLHNASPQVALGIQNLLIHVQPQNLRLVGERALLHLELGNEKSALSDLKRYFAFKGPLDAPSSLLMIYKHLREILENRVHS